MSEDGVREVRGSVRQGTNPHVYWCIAKKSVEDEGRPCLMVKQSAIDLGLVISFDEETHDVTIEGPKELMVSLMQDMYESKNGKPFKLTLDGDVIEGLNSGPDHLAFILKDSGPLPDENIQ